MKTLKLLKWIAAYSALTVGIAACQKAQENGTVNTAVNPVVVPELKSTEIANYYVSPAGSDNNPGTVDKPFRSIEKAYAMASAGMLVYFRGGVYTPVNPKVQVPLNFMRGKSGAAGKLIRFWAYPGETPVIDLGKITYTGGTIWGLALTGNYWHWKGFELRNLPPIAWKYNHAAMVAYNCNNCIFENLRIHDNSAMGFVLSGNSTNNLILNSDSYRNQDPGTTSDPYGNADGFHIGPMANTSCSNTVQGCRAWANSDDGYDMYYNEGCVTLINCYAFSNGYRVGTSTPGGDGVGFKLGNSRGSYVSVKRTLSDCIAASNRLTGYDLNDGQFAVKMTRCNAYANRNHGIYLNKYGRVNQLSNCISIYSGSGYNALVTAQSTVYNCSWKGFSVTSANFVSCDIARLSLARNADGSLPASPFMQLTTSSSFQYK